MDLITQGILGAAVGQATGMRQLGRKAIIAGAIGGLIPDLDVLFKYFFLHGEMLYHRGFTHSLWFGPVLGTILGYLLHRYYKENLWSWIMVMIGSILTHPLLDLFTVYGTQLFAPFSNQRFSIPAVPIIDLFYSVPLLGGVLYGLFFPKKGKIASLIATILLTTSTGYVVWGYRHNCLAETYARESLLNEGLGVSTIHAFPTILQIYLRRVVAHCHNRKGEKQVKIGYLSTWNLDANPTIIWQTKIFTDDPVLSPIQEHPMAKLFTWFAEEHVFLEKINDAVFIRDLRYGFPGSPVWGIWSMAFYPESLQGGTVSSNRISSVDTNLVETSLVEIPFESNWQPSFERMAVAFHWDTIKGIYKTAFGDIAPHP